MVPAALGAHAGLSGPFTLMEFATFRPVVFLDSETSSLFLERREETTAYQRILGALAHTAPEPDGIVWHASSYSGNCVQVAPAPDRVLVRDSKNPTGPALAVPTAAWHAFLTTTR